MFQPVIIRHQSMKIGIQTWGSDGDIRPFIALAGGLSSAGHEVKLVVTSVDNKDYTTFGKSLNFRTEHTGPLRYSTETYAGIADQLGKEKNILKQLDLIFRHLFYPAEREMYSAAQKLCRGNDIVISHFIVHPLKAAAEISGRPFITVNLNHSAIPSRYLPPSGVPDLGGMLNSISWKLVVAVINRYFLPQINSLRKQEGLRPAVSVRDVWESKLLNLIAVSPVFCSRKPDWESYHQVSGFFNMPEKAEAYTMPEDLMAFLGSGPPPVYMTFGSLISPLFGSRYVFDSTSLMVDAARRAGCRAVIQSCWDHIEGIEEDGNIFRIINSPHQFIFPLCAAVVHHGGAGTTQSATRAGRPSVVVAHVTDQVFWGNELRRLGIAPRLVHRQGATAEKLAHSIRTVLGSPAMKEKAGKLGEQIRGEDGVRSAVEAIEKICASLAAGKSAGQ